jgi:hypothetical protein
MRVPYHKLGGNRVLGCPAVKAWPYRQFPLPWDQNMVHGTHFVIHLLLFWVALHYSFPKSSMEAKKIEIELDGGLGQSSKTNLSVRN